MAGTVDLGPAKLNVRTARGDTVNLSFTIREGGTAVDITGRTYTAKLRKASANPTGSGAAVPFTVDVTDPETGQLVLRLAQNVTAGLGGRYVWDLQQTDGTEIRTLVAGEWTFEADVAS